MDRNISSSSLHLSVSLILLSQLFFHFQSPSHSLIHPRPYRRCHRRPLPLHRRRPFPPSSSPAPFAAPFINQIINGTWSDGEVRCVSIIVVTSDRREVSKIYNLSKFLKKIQDANEESKVVTKAAAMKVIKKHMKKDIDEVLKIARITKSKLEELDKHEHSGSNNGRGHSRFPPKRLNMTV